MQPKRILISILVVILFIFSTITAVAAQESAPALELTLTQTSEDGFAIGDGLVLAVGDIVEISVTAGNWNGEENLGRGQFEIAYNASALQFVSADYADGVGGYIEGGMLKIMALDAFPADTVLIVAKFEVKNVAHGDFNVTLPADKIEIYDEELSRIATSASGVAALHVHKFADAVVVPGCVSEGYTAYECLAQGCGYVLKTDYTPVVGHDYSGPDATCTTDKVCAACGEVLIAKHESGCKAAENNNPCEVDTCCVYCNRVLVQKHGAHDESGADATCTTEKVCAREGCTVVLQQKLGHLPSAEATCTASMTCTRCQVVLAPAFGHKSGNAATCTRDSVCSICNAVLAKAKGHLYEAEATCVAAKVCKTCGHMASPALGHNYGEWVLTEEATRRANGVETKTCLVCGAAETREVAFEGLAIWVILVIVFGSFIVVAGGLFAFYWFVLKDLTKSAGGFDVFFISLFASFGKAIKGFFVKIFGKKSAAATEEVVAQSTEEATEETTEAVVEEVTEEATEE